MAGLISVSASAVGACIQNKEAIKCWGLNTNQQLGNINSAAINAGNYSTYPLVVDVVSTFGATAIWAGPYSTCVLIDTEVQCWGGTPTNYSR